MVYPVYNAIQSLNNIFLVVFNRISLSQDRVICRMTFTTSFCLSFLGEYYIGLNDLQGTGAYKWADGTNASFTNWNTSFPRGGKGVVMMLKENSDHGKWRTRNSSRTRMFICECPEGPCTWSYLPTFTKNAQSLKHEILWQEILTCWSWELQKHVEGIQTCIERLCKYPLANRVQRLTKSNSSLSNFQVQVSFSVNCLTFTF